MTFLPVSSVRGRAYKNNRLEGENGFIGFAPDCLDYDEQYKNIIDYLLGRVVFVDNMDNALKMSKIVSDFRFVTLDGDVINARGAITGGKYRNKTANILDRKAEIISLRKEILLKSDEQKSKEMQMEELREKLGRFSETIAESELSLIHI